MKKICPNLHNKEVAKEFNELKDLFGEEAAHLLWSRNNGYSIDKAPNGADSILFGELLHVANGDRTKALILKAKVYSKDFLNWFGDWTSEDKSNVSKVVDKNGEPQATYHTVAPGYDPSFKKFDTNIDGTSTAIYHTDSYEMSASYNPVSREKEEGNRLGYYINDDNYPYTKIDYLNIKNPKIVDAKGHLWNDIHLEQNDNHNVSTRDLERKYLRYKKDAKEPLEKIAKLKDSAFEGDISYTKINKELKEGKNAYGLTFKRDNNGNILIGVEFMPKNGFVFSPYNFTSGEQRDEMFKYQLINFLSNIQDYYLSYESDGSYDGVIVNNVIDYSALSVEKLPHTVYEARDNSQVKSVFNNGKFSDPDNIYESKSAQEKQLQFRMKLTQSCVRGTRYLLPQYQNEISRNQLLYELRLFNPNISFRRNEKGKWFWGYNNIKSSIFNAVHTKGHTMENVNTDKVFASLNRKLKNSPELKLITEILSKFGKSKLIEFRFVDMDPDVAAEFHPAENEKDMYIAINSREDVIFRNNSNLSDYMAQTILHELVHAYTYYALHNDSKLREEAENLRQYLIRNLGENSEYGLSNIYEMLAELTNVDFVNKMKVLPATKSYSILAKVRSFFSKFFHKILGGKRSAYEDAIDLLFKAVQSDRYPDMVDNIKDDATTNMKSISASQDKVDQIHKEITNLYQQLYKNYKKQLNKGINKQKREDSLWSTIRDLQAKDKKQASSIAIHQAFQQIGTYTLDPKIGVVPARRDTVLGYLQEQARTNFDNLSADQIFDMKHNIIDFYNDLCKYLFDDKNNLDVQDQLNIEKLSSTVHEVNRLWRQAARVVGDKIVDQNVDNYLNTNPQEAEDIKTVAKDWLHNNDMWGDEGRITLFFNFSRQDSPIIKQAFQMIQDAVQETRKQTLVTQQKLVKAYNKASSLVEKVKLGNWQTEFMERDNDGNFTGLFRSAVNRGQFKKDLENFKQKLDDKWDKTYGYHYITDQVTGETLRSDTMSSIENETWNNGTPPLYVEYSIELETWICNNAHRRYSNVYYMERLSQPYDIATGKGHGLSPRTLSRQKYIQDQLNYILQKCSDKKTGLSYPERLSTNDYNKLQMWKDALQDLGNPFDKYGNRKSGEELQTALEIQAWNNWLAEQTQYNTDYDAYDAEYQSIVDAINRGEKTQDDLYRFIDANSEWGINPEFLEYVFGNNQSQKDYVTRMFQNSIKKLVKTKNGYRKNFSDVIFNYNPDGSVSVPDIWGYSRLADIKNNQQANQDGIDVEAFRNNFDVQQAIYTDPSGMCVAKDGVTKFDIQNNPHGLQPMTWFDYILKQYTDAAMDGRMDRFVSIDGSTAVDFSTFNGNRSKIEQWIAENILMYEKTWEDKNGITKSKMVPLSIFNMLIPKVSTFGPENKPTSRFVPKGRFTTKSSNQPLSIFDKYFSEDDRSGIQPDFDIYGDEEFVKMIKKGGAKAEFYKLLLDTMEEQWDKLGLDPSYNRYKLPQIEGTSAMKTSRAFKHPSKYVKNQVQNITEATSDDIDMRSNEDYVMRNGKWVLKTAPTRYISELEDPSMISSDLAYTVGQFVQMTNNYLNKQKLQAKLETLGYNLASENRDINHQTTGTRQYDRYEKMLQALFYEQKEVSSNPGEKPGRTQIASAKAARMARSGTAKLMLSYNLPSMFVGVWDSFIQLPALAARGDQFGFKEYFGALLHTFPNLFAALTNIGNPIANCKAVAMMQKDGLVKTPDETFKNQYQSRIRRALAQAATGGYTMGDYMMNMLGQRCTYEAKKYYPGNQFIEEGFYTKGEFDRLMSGRNLSQKEINRDWKSKHGESLWDAYYFDKGVAKLKSKYEGVKTQDSKLSGAIQQTMSLINGNAAKNDQSAVSNNILHRFFFLMRNFFIRRTEHWFAGYKPDNIVREFDDTTETIHRGSSTFQRTVRKKKPLTQEQKSRRQAYDYSTGEANPAVAVNLMRGALSQLAIFNQIMFHKQERELDPRHINPNEAKALREFVVWGLCLALLSLGWMTFHRSVQDDTDKLKPTSYKQSTPGIDNFIKQKIYLKIIDQCWFRVIDSQLQAWNPWQFVDMIKSATTVTSAVEKLGSIPSAGLDLAGLSGHDLDETIKSDSKYKYFPRWQRALWTATPLNNIQTWSSWRGNDKVGRWYFDNTVTGTIFKSGGYGWKKGDDSEENDSNNIQKFRMRPMRPMQMRPMRPMH